MSMRQDDSQVQRGESTKPDRRWSTAWPAIAAASTLVAATALAQQAPAANGEDLAEVVVTGSRIRGVEAVGSPVIALSHDDIVATGAATTGDLLRKLPQIIGLGASETAASAQNGAANVTRGLSVNLRGLGSNATLLLFGGRRMPPAGTQGQITDASVIPSLAIERLEVVADGGSAIYGSDAVTGVVNIIPRRDFKGAETTLRVAGASGYHDWSAGQIFGTDWSHGHLMAALDYEFHAALNGQDRSFYTSNLTPFGGTDFRSQQCSPGTILVGTVPYAIPQTSLGSGLTAGQFTANTRNLCDNLKRGDIIPETRRISAMLSGTLDINEQLSLYTEDFWSRRTFHLQANSISSNLTVTNANPFYFNPSGGTGPVTVQYDFANDGGLPRDPGYALSWQGVAGARQKLGGDWRADLSLSYGRSQDEVSRTHNLNTTTAGIAAALALTSTSTAFNPFGGGGVSNAATVAAVRNGQTVIDGDTTLTVAALQADGSLLTLPGGKLRLAVGAEYRKEGLGGSLASGSTVAPVIVPSNSSRNVKAAYAETYVPVFGDSNARTGLRRLDLSVAGRYEQYSDFGNTFNPKVGAVWVPVNGLKIQGSWGKSFRAPGLAETDPKSSGYGLYGDTLPCSFLPPATTCFGIGIAGGNPSLKPEKATTWSTGIDLTPAAVTGLHVSATYFHIDYTDQILALRGTTGLLTNPIYGTYATLNPSAAAVSALLASGQPINSPINAALVTYIQDGRRQNLGGTFARGYDFDLDQTWQTGMGKLRAGFNGTYFTTLTTSTTASAPQVDVLGTIGFPQRFRGRAELGLSSGLFNGALYYNYVSSYLQTSTVRISAYHTFDLHAGFDLGSGSDGLLHGLNLSLDIQNIGNSDPPFVNLAGGYDPQSASPIGRLASVSLRKSW